MNILLVYPKFSDPFFSLTNVLKLISRKPSVFCVSFQLVINHLLSLCCGVGLIARAVFKMGVRVVNRSIAGHGARPV